MLFKEIIPVSSENQMKPIDTKCSYAVLKQVTCAVTTWLFRVMDMT
jgi:hypothetical protein